MLPDFLNDSYKQYKDDTDRFATWLVNAAKELGHQPVNPPSAPIRGKKKEAGQFKPFHCLGSRYSVKLENKSIAAKLYRMTGAETPQIKYQVTIGELLKLSRAVSESPVKAPTSVLAIAKRAIALRKNVTSWFLGRGCAASNKRHAHFTEVMEKICDILAWEAVAVPVTARSGDIDDKVGGSTGSDKIAYSQAWMNRFAALGVEEVVEGPDTAATDSDVIRVEAVEEDQEEDAEGYLSPGFFRLLCLFHDLQNWRSFLSDTVSFAGLYLRTPFRC